MEELNDSFDSLGLESDLEGSTESGDNNFEDEIEGSYSDESEENVSDMEIDVHPDGWKNVEKGLSGFVFDNMECSTDFSHYETPLDFYLYYMNDDIIDYIVDETNKHGAERNQDWNDITTDDWRVFLTMILQMGIVKLPTLRLYWSDRVAIGGRSHMSHIMARNKFERILRNLHFVDNSKNNGDDRLYKIRRIVDDFNEKAEAWIPGETVAIDESLIPFRGKVGFRQYSPLKRHKFGIKVFKLCSVGGYTHKIIVYTGQIKKSDGSVAENIIMNL